MLVLGVERKSLHVGFVMVTRIDGHIYVVFLCVCCGDSNSWLHNNVIKGLFKAW